MPAALRPCRQRTRACARRTSSRASGGHRRRAAPSPQHPGYPAGSGACGRGMLPGAASAASGLAAAQRVAAAALPQGAGRAGCLPRQGAARARRARRRQPQATLSKQASKLLMADRKRGEGGRAQQRGCAAGSALLAWPDGFAMQPRARVRTPALPPSQVWPWREAHARRRGSGQGTSQGQGRLPAATASSCSNSDGAACPACFRRNKSRYMR